MSAEAEVLRAVRQYVTVRRAKYAASQEYHALIRACHGDPRGGERAEVIAKSPLSRLVDHLDHAEREALAIVVAAADALGAVETPVGR